MDAARVGPLQYRMAALCGVLGLCDGFDNQALAFSAPTLAKAFGVKATALAPVFSAGLFGLMLGALLFGSLSDRIGRRNALLLAGSCFSLFTLLTPLAHSFESLAALRFLAGLGIGGVPPTAAALVAEYTPAARRSTFVNWMLIGIPVGGFVGGFIAAAMIPRLGWTSVFLAGGSVSLMLVAACAFGLKETLPFLARREARRAEAEALAARLDPSFSPAAGDALVSPDAPAGRGALARVFSAPLLRLTLLFFAVEFIALGLFYVLVNWTPTLLRENGVPPALAIMGSSALNLGGILGGVAFGPLCDRFGARRIAALSFVMTAAALAAMSSAGAELAIMLPALFLGGWGAIAGQGTCVALMNESYPTAIRSTGVGASMTFGRLGAILSPALVAIPLNAGWSVKALLLLPIAPALAGAALTLAARLREGEAPAS